MSVYTFSTKSANGAEVVKRIKDHCRKYGKNFSFIVVQALIEWEQKQNEAASVSKTR